ncbi:hypothetical protein VNO77_27347 [Canavalia gladiata]|uniref:Uncharacterized protein n=1 Tax=Canavalia gladiata TaxID=3824 RepID=A0AAN9KV68_CANGL
MQRRGETGRFYSPLTETSIIEPGYLLNEDLTESDYILHNCPTTLISGRHLWFMQVLFMLTTALRMPGNYSCGSCSDCVRMWLDYVYIKIGRELRFLVGAQMWVTALMELWNYFLQGESSKPTGATIAGWQPLGTTMTMVLKGSVHACMGHWLLSVSTCRLR